MNTLFKAVAAAAELPPLAGPDSSYFSMGTSERVHIIAETFGGYKTNTCGVYDYQYSKWRPGISGVKNVLFWLKMDV